MFSHRRLVKAASAALRVIRGAAGKQFWISGKLSVGGNSRTRSMR
jgi:hypothetical protein